MHFLTVAKRNVSWPYDVRAYSGEQTANDRDDLVKSMIEHNCLQKNPPLFIIMKAGQGEDSWNPNINGLVDMNQRVYVDANGFLTVGEADEVSKDGDRKHNTHLGRRRSRQTLAFSSFDFPTHLSEK